MRWGVCIYRRLSHHLTNHPTNYTYFTYSQDYVLLLCNLRILLFWPVPFWCFGSATNYIYNLMHFSFLWYISHLKTKFGFLYVFHTFQCCTLIKIIFFLSICYIRSKSFKNTYKYYYLFWYGFFHIWYYNKTCMSRCTFLYGSLPYSIIHYALYMDTDPPKYSNAKHASAEYLNNFDIKPRNLTGNRFRSSCQVLNKMCYLCRQKRSLLNYQLQRMRMSDWDLRKWLQYVRIVYRIPL